MGKPRKTGNPLFDIIWAEWPPRITGKGTWEKRKKGPARKEFEKINPTEEEAYDMADWIKKDKECREKAKREKGFFSSPADLVVWLKAGGWEDEIGIEITDSDRYEKKRSSDTKQRAIATAKEEWRGVIMERSVQDLLNNKGFRHFAKAYPEFRAWAISKRPELDGAKADHITRADKKVSQPRKPVIEPISVEVTQDLPPPTMKDKIAEKYRDVKMAKENGVIGQLVKKLDQFSI